MALSTALVGSLVVGGGLAGGALISRALLRHFRIEPLDEDIEIEEVYNPWDYIDVDLAMPTQLDFPQGWTTYDEGADGNDNWGIGWRLLLLRAPTPDGHRIVTVVSAHAPGYAKDGWGTAPDPNRAIEQLNVFRRQAESVAEAVDD
jgi:hypothetical protein